MVTVVKTPQGHKIIDQAIEAVVTDSGGDALVTFAYHGLATGDFIYVASDLEEYNGFWYVTAINTDSFKMSEYAGADYVEYYRDMAGGSGSEFTYYQTQEHDWSSIFLPIVYKLSNDRWPTNTFDTVRTISSQDDDAGYTELTLSGSLKSAFEALEYVKITGAGDLDGVYQIIEKVSSSIIVINMPYNIENEFTAASIQYYYNNYQVKVKVYAGLNVLHPWQAKKPYTEVAELSFTPDEDNIVMFSVSDYIKSKVNIKNNPILFSMPLNLDAFTGFYIATSETYDDSDGYALTTNTTSYLSDTFEGYAIAGKLPFKNTYSGDYAEYVYTSGEPAAWLTLMTRLIAVEDKYFDISFIKNVIGEFSVIVTKYVSDYATTTDTVNYEDQGIGVYRIVLGVDSNYDYYCIEVRTIAQAAVPGDESPVSLPDLSEGVNIAGPGQNWTPGAAPTVSVVATSLGQSVASDIWANDYAFTPGNTYEFTPDIDYNNDRIMNLYFVILDEDNNILESDVNIISDGVGTFVGQHEFIAPTGAVKYGYYLSFLNSFGTNTNTLTINSIAATETTPGTPEVEANTITEEICIDIIESCEAQNGFTPTDIRLLEDGSYRLLE